MVIKRKNNQILNVNLKMWLIAVNFDNSEFNRD